MLTAAYYFRNQFFLALACTACGKLMHTYRKQRFFTPF
jgi:hypothetical protein